jgi:dipeptidyl aminopeptidase/acylaminoacyl peptidase
VWSVPVRGGRAERDLMPESDLMCGECLLSDVDEPEPAAPVWSRDGDRIFVLASQDGATNVWEVPAAGGMPRARSNGAHALTQLSQSADGRRWGFVRRTPVSAGEIHVATAGAGNGIVPGADTRAVTAFAKAWRAARAFVPPERFTVPARDGHRVDCWMLRARGAPRRGPAVLMIHGGPYAMYGAGFFLEFQLLRNRGYHVVLANLRGSTGYGRAYMRALVGAWGHRDYDDLMRVTDVVERLDFVDPARIAVAGGSYGGYLTAWAIAHTRRYRAAISMRGVSNLISMFGTGDLGNLLLPEFEGQAPWESIERWWRVSPLAHVGAIQTPLLLLHPEDDLRAPVSQSEELFAALRHLGRDVEFVRFPGESHGLSRSGRPRARIERLRCIVDWLDRKL